MCDEVLQTQRRLLFVGQSAGFVPHPKRGGVSVQRYVYYFESELTDLDIRVVSQ